MQLNHPELTDAALAILRKGDNFQWYFIPLLAFTMYVYFSEIERKNWKGIAAGLSLYATHWLYEIANAMIQYFSGHALWTVPTGTSFLLLVGVGWELSMMFAVAGVIFSKILPADPKARILGVNNRVAIAVGNAAMFSVIEIFLARTPAFHWVYPWWGSLPVFVTVYVPFFLMSNFAYDWKPKTQKLVIGSLIGVDVMAMLVFAGVLRWI
jgi:TM2 domain-containing membrane protein YozV